MMKEDPQSDLTSAVGHTQDEWAPEQNQLQLATANLHGQANNVSRAFPDSNIVVGLQSGKTLHWYWYINGPEAADDGVREKIKSHVQELVHDRLNSVRLRRSDLEGLGSHRRPDIKHEMVQFLQSALDSGVISRLQLSALLARLVGDVEPGNLPPVSQMEDLRSRPAKRQRSHDPHSVPGFSAPLSMGMPSLPNSADQVSVPTHTQPAEELAQELNRRCFVLAQQGWDQTGRLAAFNSPQPLDDKSTAERTALSSEQRSLLLALIAKHAVHSENYTSAVIQEFHDVYPNVQVKAGYIRKLKCKNTKLPSALPPNNMSVMGNTGLGVLHGGPENVGMVHLGDSDGDGDMQDGPDDDPQVGL